MMIKINDYGNLRSACIAIKKNITKYKNHLNINFKKILNKYKDKNSKDHSIIQSPP